MGCANLASDMSPTSNYCLLALLASEGAFEQAKKHREGFCFLLSSWVVAQDWLIIG